MSIPFQMTAREVVAAMSFMTGSRRSQDRPNEARSDNRNDANGIRKDDDGYLYQNDENDRNPFNSYHGRGLSYDSKNPFNSYHSKDSFSQDDATHNPSLWDPLAPPPIAPPPPPPPSDSDVASIRSFLTVDSLSNSTHDNHDDDRIESDSANGRRRSLESQRGYTAPPDYPVAYQHSGTSPTGPYDSRKARGPAPYPTGYDSMGYAEDYGSSGHFRTSDRNDDDHHLYDSNGSHLLIRGGGDATVRPNIGHTNDEYGGIGSLAEVTANLRWMTIVTCIVAIIWEGFAFPMRLLGDFVVHPARVVLGGYLAVFCVLLLGVELNMPLREHFGFLYHPIGRGGLLFLMSGMCFGILVQWWETLLGLAFLVCCTGYWFAYWKYPEYRKWQTYNDNKIWTEVRNVTRNSRIISWANPYNHDPSSLPNLPSNISEERTSLLTRF